MSDPFIGEIRMFGGNFAPNGWVPCDGRLLSIAESDLQPLFNLIGTTYGGDGFDTFAVPDLRGRVPVHAVASGSSFVLGQSGGVEQVTLTTNQIPVHTHAARGTSDGGTATDPTNAVWAQTPQIPYHAPPSAPAVPVDMAADNVSVVGGSQSHDNMPPFLSVNFIMSLFGIFPSQS